LTEIIIKTLKLNDEPDNVPFLISFRDIIHDYSQKYPSEVESFIEYWEEFGIKKNLKIPEKQNAINIITIHKAKGLAADIVFVPFCTWQFAKAGSLQWCKIDQEPFNVLPIWPVNFDAKMSNSIVQESYQLEKFRRSIESFNLLYVAFTRARKALYISASSNPKDDAIYVENSLNLVLNDTNFRNEIKLKVTDDEIYNSTEYSIGNVPVTAKTDNETKYFDKYPIYVPTKNIIIKSYFDRDKIDVNSDSIIHKGIIFHKLFEKILCYEDIDRAVMSAYRLGEITEEQTINYKQEIEEILSNGFIKPWFDKTYKVSTEVEIINKEGQIKRLDRLLENDSEIVIVDYKFGSIENNKYQKQLLEYSNLLKDMGYKTIKTYIWYVLLGYVIEIGNYESEVNKIELN
jgi:ATP-dependent exoDNAse (exonuclease V) beta subunit